MNSLKKFAKLWLSSWRSVPSDAAAAADLITRTGSAGAGSRLFSFINSALSSSSTGIMLLFMTMTTVMGGASIVYDTMINPDSPINFRAGRSENTIEVHSVSMVEWAQTINEIHANGTTEYVVTDDPLTSDPVTIFKDLPYIPADIDHGVILPISNTLSHGTPRQPHAPQEQTSQSINSNEESGEQSNEQDSSDSNDESGEEEVAGEEDSDSEEAADGEEESDGEEEADSEEEADDDNANDNEDDTEAAEPPPPAPPKPPSLPGGGGNSPPFNPPLSPTPSPEPTQTPEPTPTPTATPTPTPIPQTGFSITEPAALTYGDAPVQLEATGGQAGDITWEVTNGNAASISTTGRLVIKSAGEVTITATKAGNENYTPITDEIIISIAKRDLSNAAFNIAGTFVYTGTQHTPTPTATDGTNNLITAADFTYTHSNNTNAGNASINITATENGNYTGTATINFTIQAAPLTVTADSHTIVFNQPPPTFTSQITGFVNGENSTVLNGTLSHTTNYTAGDPHGMYDITPYGLTADNYEINFINGILTVGVAGQTALNIPEHTPTYGDTPFALNVTGGAGDGLITYETSNPNTLTIDNDGTVTIHNAGTATITVNKAADSNGNFTATSANRTITVAKRDISLAAIAPIAPLTYTGNQLQPTPNVSDIAPITTSDYTVSHGENINAVTGGTVTITATSTGNYTGTQTASFTIERATPNASHLAFSLTPVLFNNSPQSVTVTPNANGLGTITVLYDGLIDAPVNAGTYAVTVDIAQGDNFTAITALSLGNFTIEKSAAPTILFPTSATAITYGETLADSTLNTIANTYGTFTWTSPDTVPTVSQSGNTFSVTFTPTAPYGTNYNWTELTANVPVTVNPAPLTVEFTAENKVYDGSTTATITTRTITAGILANDNVGITGGTANFTNANVGTDITVTADNFTLTGTHADNYTIAAITPIAANITPLQLTWNANGTVNNKTYDGTTTATVQTPPTLNGVLTNDTVTVTTGTANFASANAGTHAIITANWGISGTNNYTAPAAQPIFANATINKATPEYTIPTGLTAAFGDSLSSVTLPTGWAWENPTASIGNAGTRTHSAIFTPADTTNYLTITQILQIAVTPINQTGFSITPPNPLTYGDTPVQLEATGGQAGNITWEITNGNAASVSATGWLVIERAGEVTITATRAGNENYNPVTDEIIITIAKRDLSNVSFNVTGTFIYTGTPHAPTPTATDGTNNLINAADFTYTHSNNTNAGNASVNITATENGNYTGTATINFTIQAAPLTVTADSHTIVFNQPPPTFTSEITGFINGEDSTVLNGTLSHTTTYTIGDPTGMYDITPYGLTADNYEITYVNGILTVGVAGQTALNIPEHTPTYGDLPFALNVTGGSGDGLITYETSTPNVLTIDTNGTITIHNAGTATITVNKAADSNENFTATSANRTITVAKRDISLVTITPIAPLTYTGNQLQPTPIVSDIAAITTNDYTVSHGTNTDVSTSGTVTITATTTGNYTGTQTVSFTIERATPNASHLTFSLTPVTFNGTAQSVTVTPNASGLGAITVLYDGLITAPTNAGTYAVTVDITQGDNFTAITALSLGNFTIEKAAAPTIIFPTSATAITYGETLADSALDTTSNVYGTFAFTSPATVPTVSQSGNTFSVTFTPIAPHDINYNWEITTANIPVTVNPAPLTISFTAQDKTYDGTTAAIILTRTITGLLHDDEVYVTSGTANFTSANAAANITVTAENFTLTGAHANNYTIATITPTTATIHRDTPAYTIPAGLTAAFGDTLSSVALPTGWAWENPTATAGNAGTRTHAAIFTPTDTTNYLTIIQNLQITVNTINQINFAITSPAALTYGDAPVQLETTGGQAGDVTWAVTSGSAITVAPTTGYIAIESAGTATITATRAGDENHNPVTDEITITVAQRSINNATFAVNETLIYTGNPHTPTPTATDGINNLITAADFSYVHFNNINATTTAAAIQITATPSGNYTGTAEINFTIQPAPLTVTADSHTIVFTQPPPTFTSKITGFVNDEDETVLNGTLSYATNPPYTAGSPRGMYDIIPSGLTAANYNITFVNGFLTVGVAGQVALYIPTHTPTYGDAPFPLNVTGGSGDGLITYETSNPNVLTIDTNGTVTIHNAGTATITVTKAADSNGDFTATSTNSTITVSQRNISLAAIAPISPLTYTGAQLQPIPIVTDTPIITAYDYTISYSNNINVTTSAALTITATPSGNYTGTQTASFEIERATPNASHLTFSLDPVVFTSSPQAITVSPAAIGLGTITVNYSTTTTPPTNAGTYAITADITQGDNFTAITGLPLGNFTITPATAPVITFPTYAAPITYGETLSAAALNITFNDYGTFAFTTSSAALQVSESGNQFEVTFTPSAPHDINYNWTTLTATVPVTVNPAPLTIEFTAENKVFDGNTTAAIATRNIATGIVNADDVTVTGGTAEFDDRNAANGITVTAANFTLTGADADNYTIVTVNHTTANITPATITITGVTAADRVYDATTQITLTGGALQGIIGSDTVGFTIGNGTIASPNVGTDKAVTTDIQLTGTHHGNYTLTQPTEITVNITAAPLTIANVAATTRVYNGTTAVTLTGGTLQGVISGDTVTFTLGNGETSRDVGTNKAVTTNITLTGTHSGNYTLTQPTDITVNITAATLTIADVTATNRDYNGTTTVTLTGGTLQGVISGDTVTFTLGNGTIATADAETNKAVTTAITLDGTHSGNYTLTQPTGITVNINPATPTLATAPTASSVIAGQTLQLSTIEGGAVNGITGNITGTWEWQTPTETMNTAGTHQRTVIFKPDSPNYTTLSHTVNVTVNNPININTATINVTSTHEYNRAAQTPTFTVTHSGNTLTEGTHYTNVQYTNNTNAGTATITLTGIGIYAGTATQNFTITAKPLTWATSGTVHNKTYNGNTNATVATAPTLGGVISPDVVTVTTGTVAFTNTNAGTHAVTASGTWGITGASASNYTITTLPTFSNGTITQATPTVVTVPTATVAFGNALNSVTPTGGVVNGIAGETNLAGAWVWETPTATISVNGIHAASFTSGCGNYLPVTANVSVTAINQPQGSGTSTDPFRIYNETDLRAVGRGANHKGNGTWSLSAHYLLMTNITLEQGDWTPIGMTTFISQFTGTFNGGGHYICGLTITNSTRNDVGMFSVIGSNGAVRNLGIRNANVTSNSFSIGGIAGGSDGLIENCYVQGTISGGRNVGGIVGATGGGRINKCFVIGTVISTTGAGAGGIVAWPTGGTTVSNCWTDVNVTAATVEAGGIIGSNNGWGSAVSNNFALGTVRNGTLALTQRGHIGGIAGNTGSGSLRNNVALNTSITVNSSNATPLIARIAGGTPTTAANYINNYARSNMTITISNGSTSTSSRTQQTNGNDGANITSAEWLSAAWWQGTVDFDPLIWDLADGRLPILRDMPGGVSQNSIAPASAPITFSVMLESSDGTMTAVIPADFPNALNAFSDLSPLTSDPDSDAWALTSASAERPTAPPDFPALENSSSENSMISDETPKNFFFGTEVTVTAVAPQGFILSHWQDESGNILSHSTVYTFIITRDITLTAISTPAPAPYHPDENPDDPPMLPKEDDDPAVPNDDEDDDPDPPNDDGNDDPDPPNDNEDDNPDPPNDDDNDNPDNDPADNNSDHPYNNPNDPYPTANGDNTDPYHPATTDHPTETAILPKEDDPIPPPPDDEDDTGSDDPPEPPRPFDILTDSLHDVIPKFLLD